MTIEEIRDAIVAAGEGETDAEVVRLLGNARNDLDEIIYYRETGKNFGERQQDTARQSDTA